MNMVAGDLEGCDVYLDDVVAIVATAMCYWNVWLMHDCRLRRFFLLVQHSYTLDVLWASAACGGKGAGCRAVSFAKTEWTKIDSTLVNMSCWPIKCASISGRVPCN